MLGPLTCLALVLLEKVSIRAGHAQVVTMKHVTLQSRLQAQRCTVFDAYKRDTHIGHSALKSYQRTATLQGQLKQLYGRDATERIKFLADR